MQESTARQRQDAALKDPFNYSPYDQKSDAAGGASKSDKGAIQKDLKSVFNP